MNNKLKRRRWKKKILQSTLEVFAAPIDLVLFAALLTLAVSAGPPDTIKGLSNRIDKVLGSGSNRMIRNALYNCRRRRLFRKDYALTIEGLNRLEKVIPRVLSGRHWDGSWYVVNYDIPETVRHKRYVLRENIQRLGFGQLQKSIWISPINYLGAVEEFVKHYKLEPYVILSETNRMGEEVSRDLANRVWDLGGLNKDYRTFIGYWKKERKDKNRGVEGKNRIWPMIRYLSILKRDPQLPEELLPDDWCGFEAHEIVDKFFKKERKSYLSRIIFRR